MTPRGEPRGRKFTFVLTEEERSMLEQLAAADQRSSSDWIRVTIREAYDARFGGKKPKR